MYQKLNTVDFLRGFSIFTIVLMHLLQSYQLPVFFMTATSFGGAGVHVFILCSGFGLYLSYLNRPLRYKDFLRRRFGRIYWPMAVVCILTSFWLAYQGKNIMMPLLSNLFLFKMFVPEQECSMGGQMWFVSTIIQFYIFLPLIVKLVKLSKGFLYAFAISLLWATVVGISGCSEERVWNSFFLQYLWEFCLGMKVAEGYLNNPDCFYIPKFKYLLLACFFGMMLTGFMGYMGFPWKLYNDIPSLIGYTSLALIIYKLGINVLNNFFCFTNSISYEWYLVHILVFQVLKYMLFGCLPVGFEILICLIASYASAMAYARLFKLNFRKERHNK